MKKILIVLAVLAVLATAVVAGLLVFVSVRLNSEATREQIRAAVAEKTGADIRIGRHKISLLGEATLEAVALANAAPHEQSPLVSLQHFNAKISLASLLSGTPVVERVEIRGLEANLHQDAEGGFRLPFKTAPDEAGAGAPAEPQEAQAKLSARVESVEVAEVTLKVFDPDQAVLAAVSGLSASGQARLDAGEPSAQLNAKIAELQVTPGLKASNISTPVVLESGKARLSKILADFCGGKAEGEAQAELFTPGRPFTARMTVRESRMEGVLQDIGGNPETLTGALQLDFDGAGSLDAPKDLAGKGTFKINAPVVGKLRNPIIPAGMLGVPALQTGKFDAIEGTYRIEGQNVVVEQLNVLSKGLRVGIDGTVGFDKALDLKGRLIVDASPVSKVADVAQGFMQGLLGGKKEPGEAAAPASSEVLKGGVPFTIRGTSESPVVRPVGPDPLNLVSLIAQALGFKVEGDAAPASAPAGDGGAPAESAPAAEEKPKEGLRGLLPF
jgi:hypothetical protein